MRRELETNGARMMNSLRPLHASPPINRRALLGTAIPAIAAGLSGCAVPSPRRQPNGRLPITLSSQPNGAGLPFFIGQKEGFFEEEGLVVEVANYASGPASLAAGAANEWQAGWSGAPPALTGANAFGLIPTGLMMREDENHMMFMSARVLENSSPKEVLRKYPVATSQNSLADQVMRGCAEQFGVPGEEVEIVPLDGGAVVQALQSGQVEVVNSWVTPAWPLLENPEEYVQVCSAAEAGVAVTSAFVITPRFADEEPHAAAGFLRAATRATEFINQNPDQSVEYMLEYYDTYAITGSEDQAAWEVEMRDWFTLEEVIDGIESGSSSAALTASAEFFVEAGIYPVVPPIDKLLDKGLDLLKSARDGA